MKDPKMFVLTRNCFTCVVYGDGLALFRECSTCKNTNKLDFRWKMFQKETCVRRRPGALPNDNLSTIRDAQTPVVDQSINDIYLPSPSARNVTSTPILKVTEKKSGR